LKPLFIAAVFAVLIVTNIVSIPLLRGRKFMLLNWLNLLCGILFVLFGWLFNHLALRGVLGYAFLWGLGYWIACFDAGEHFPPGRAILATLGASIPLYLVGKIQMLFSLQQNWLGYTATLLFGMGELIFLGLLVLFAWDMVGALEIRLGPAVATPSASAGFVPFVSIHLPICNEPVELVKATMAALARLDYPAYEVIVVDNNTDDPILWRAVQEVCSKDGFRFLHASPLPGYKAGALNLALANTSPQAELIAVVDADYELSADFLKDTVPAFHDPRVAFLQTSQRHRNVHASRITRLFNPIYDYFYDITMLARSQRNSIIFAGCAGLIRCQALRQAGGWAEWSITEDAELSLRLLACGYRGVYINRGYGTGLLPGTFENIRRQWFRYFSGGLEITRRHLFPTILARNKLTIMQRLHFVMGGLINLGAALMLASSTGIIVTALTYSLLRLFDPIRAAGMFYWLKVFSSWLLIFDCFQALGLFLLLLVFRLAYPINWLETFHAAGAILSLMTTQARAAVWVLSGRRLTFQKTPRSKDVAVGKAGLRPVLFELTACLTILLALAGLFWAVPSKPVVLGEVVLGLWQVMIYGSTIWRALQPA
jgi:cellulose synthase/poly-beta-1,6-N-acetylglucosamine synthase-like glycosyltransferase